MSEANMSHSVRRAASSPVHGFSTTARKLGTALALTAAAAAGVTVPPAAAAAEPRESPKLGECAAGEVCLWEKNGFRGARQTYDLSRVTIGSCERLPGAMSAQSFANRTGRPVTVYQSEECAETGEFHTHPSGAWTPEAEYRVRAVKIWER